eukprot:g9512.t1
MLATLQRAVDSGARLDESALRLLVDVQFEKEASCEKEAVLEAMLVKLDHWAGWEVWFRACAHILESHLSSSPQSLKLAESFLCRSVRMLSFFRQEQESADSLLSTLLHVGHCWQGKGVLRAQVLVFFQNLLAVLKSDDTDRTDITNETPTQSRALEMNPSLLGTLARALLLDNPVSLSSSSTSSSLVHSSISSASSNTSSSSTTISISCEGSQEEFEERLFTFCLDLLPLAGPRLLKALADIFEVYLPTKQPDQQPSLSSAVLSLAIERTRARELFGRLLEMWRKQVPLEHSLGRFAKHDADNHHNPVASTSETKPNSELQTGWPDHKHTPWLQVAPVFSILCQFYAQITAAKPHQLSMFSLELVCAGVQSPIRLFRKHGLFLINARLDLHPPSPAKHSASSSSASISSSRKKGAQELEPEGKVQTFAGKKTSRTWSAEDLQAVEAECDMCPQEWEALANLLAALEDHGIHLLRESWPQLATMLSPSGLPRPVRARWLSVFVRRALSSQDPVLRQHILDWLLLHQAASPLVFLDGSAPSKVGRSGKDSVAAIAEPEVMDKKGQELCVLCPPELVLDVVLDQVLSKDLYNWTYVLPSLRRAERKLLQSQLTRLHDDRKNRADAKEAQEKAIHAMRENQPKEAARPEFMRSFFLHVEQRGSSSMGLMVQLSAASHWPTTPALGAAHLRSLLRIAQLTGTFPGVMRPHVYRALVRCFASFTDLSSLTSLIADPASSGRSGYRELAQLLTALPPQALAESDQYERLTALFETQPKWLQSAATSMLDAYLKGWLKEGSKLEDDGNTYLSLCTELSVLSAWLPPSFYPRLLRAALSSSRLPSLLLLSSLLGRLEQWLVHWHFMAPPAQEHCRQLIDQLHTLLAPPVEAPHSVGTCSRANVEETADLEADQFPEQLVETHRSPEQAQQQKGSKAKKKSKKKRTKKKSKDKTLKKDTPQTKAVFDDFNPETAAGIGEGRSVLIALSSELSTLGSGFADTKQKYIALFDLLRSLSGFFSANIVLLGAHNKVLQGLQCLLKISNQQREAKDAHADFTDSFRALIWKLIRTEICDAGKKATQQEQTSKASDEIVSHLFGLLAQIDTTSLCPGSESSCRGVLWSLLTTLPDSQKPEHSQGCDPHTRRLVIERREAGLSALVDLFAVLDCPQWRNMNAFPHFASPPNLTWRAEVLHLRCLPRGHSLWTNMLHRLCILFDLSTGRIRDLLVQALVSLLPRALPESASSAQDSRALSELRGVLWNAAEGLLDMKVAYHISSVNAILDLLLLPCLTETAYHRPKSETGDHEEGMVRAALLLLLSSTRPKLCLVTAARTMQTWLEHPQVGQLYLAEMSGLACFPCLRHRQSFLLERLEAGSWVHQAHSLSEAGVRAESRTDASLNSFLLGSASDSSQEEDQAEGPCGAWGNFFNERTIRLTVMSFVEHLGEILQQVPPHTEVAERTTAARDLMAALIMGWLREVDELDSSFRKEGKRQSPDIVRCTQLWQILCASVRFLPCLGNAGHKVEELSAKISKEALCGQTSSNIRHLLESFLIILLRSEPRYLEGLLTLLPEARPTVAASIVVIAGYTALQVESNGQNTSKGTRVASDPDCKQAEMQKLSLQTLHAIFPFLCSNFGHVRTIAQYFFFKLMLQVHPELSSHPALVPAKQPKRKKRLHHNAPSSTPDYSSASPSLCFISSENTNGVRDVGEAHLSMWVELAKSKDLAKLRIRQTRYFEAHDPLSRAFVRRPRDVPVDAISEGLAEFLSPFLSDLTLRYDDVTWKTQAFVRACRSLVTLSTGSEGEQEELLRVVELSTLGGTRLVAVQDAVRDMEKTMHELSVSSPYSMKELQEKDSLVQLACRVLDALQTERTELEQQALEKALEQSSVKGGQGLSASKTLEGSSNLASAAPMDLVEDGKWLNYQRKASLLGLDSLLSLMEEAHAEPEPHQAQGNNSKQPVSLEEDAMLSARWASVGPAQDSRKHKRRRLVVVASLLDKLPNIGGLARSCEIFGAEELVINDLKILSHPEFEALSVSAHKWVRVREVPMSDLRNFLDYKRKEGLTVLALEQAVHSISLERFNFPDQAVLLLGREQTGIPVELLNAVDHCVEIPQFGIIRSLNVHVSASIMMWSFARHHLLQAHQQHAQAADNRS